MKTSEIFGVKIRTKSDILNFDNIMLWGAGSALKDCTDAVGREKISAVFDNNEKLWGTEINGWTVLPPTELKKYINNKSAIVISATKFQDEIAEKLLKKGVSENQLFGNTCYAYEKFRYIPEIIDNNYESINDTLNLLGDDYSKDYFVNYLKFCLTRNPLYLKKNPLSTEPYQYNGLSWVKDDRNVILDCGAYNGDTARLFMKKTSGNCEIYCFEPIMENYNILSSWIEREKLHNVHAFNVAVGAEKYIDSVFSDKNTGTIGSSYRGDESVSNQIQVDTLDNLVGHLPDIDYIKFDVEGFEMPALRGASNLIGKHSPIMLVSAYHKVTDMWEIPLIVMGICPKYKLYLGHQPNVPYEPEFNFVL